MHTAIMATIWLGAGVVLCLLTRPLLPSRQARVEPRRFARLEAGEWMRAAELQALRELQSAPEPVRN